MSFPFLLSSQPCSRTQPSRTLRRQVRQLTHSEHHAKFLERPGQPFTFYGHDPADPLTTTLSAGRQLQQVLKLADWIWGQFYAGDTLKASERGRLASKLLRHHRQASNLAAILIALLAYCMFFFIFRHNCGSACRMEMSLTQVSACQTFSLGIRYVLPSICDIIIMMRFD